MNKVRVAAVQMEHGSGNKRKNLATIRRFVEKASSEKVRLISFPEMCITGYWFVRNLTRDQIVALAEPVPGGPSSQELLELARKHDMLIGAGLIEIGEDGRLFNTYVVAQPTGAIHRHRKLHAFISEHIQSGDDYTVFDTAFGRVAVLTCYDNNIIENGRACALLGADILLAPHQTGGCKSRDGHSMGLVYPRLWENRERDPQAIEREFQGHKGRGWLMRWLPARAHDNGVFLVFSNGVGMDDDEVRTGNAMILDPYGRILAETCKAQDEMVVAELDPALLQHATGRRWMTTRRPALYKILTEVSGKEIPVRQSRMIDEGIA